MTVALRWAAAALCALSLSACGPAYDGDNFYKAATSWRDGELGEAAMAALAKGDYNRAEDYGKMALRRNVKDPYAILALAMVYQNTGRPELSRQYYGVLVSMHPQETVMTGMGPTAERHTIDEVAQAALITLSGVPGATYREPTAYPAQLHVPPPPSVNLSAVDPQAVEDGNIILRFQTLRRLLDEGLITRDEYNQRRGANLGALLRYGAPPPVIGLGRPAPAPEQLIERLKAISANFEDHSISAGEQAAERAVILEALIPGNPQQRANPPTPITDQMQVAALAGRLQRLREANVITGEEQGREQAIAQRALDAYTARAEAAARAAAGIMPTTKVTGPGVRLGSLRNEAQAEKLWAALQRQFPQELGGLHSSISKVTPRRGRSVYVLNAGPVTDRKAAQALCRVLKRKHQSCQPTVIK